MKLIFDYKFRFYTSTMNEICLHCYWLYYSSIVLSFRQCDLDDTFFTDLSQLGYRIICPCFLQSSRESWWNNSQGRREFQIFSLMLAARFGYKHDQWQNTDPLFWRAFLIRINKHHRTQTTKPQALTIHNIALKLLYFKLPNATLLKSRFPKYRRAI